MKKISIRSKIKQLSAVFLVYFVTVVSVYAETEQTKKENRTGKMIYETYCFACHESGLALAPVRGNNMSWQKIVKKGMDKTLEITQRGINVMPPKGLCHDCSREELMSAIDYMLPKPLLPNP